jgi:hypothetical protein
MRGHVEWLLAAAALALGAASSDAQLSRAVAARPDNCAIARPWAKPTGELLSPKTASATYQALATRWNIDTGSTSRDITTFLIRSPGMLSAMSSAAKACPPSGCACPAPPNLAQTSQIGQTLNLATSYRLDSAGTAAAVAMFVSRHTWIMSHARDSLARTEVKRAAITKVLPVRRPELEPR